MLLYRMLAVLLSLVVVVACKGSQASGEDDSRRMTNTSYKVQSISSLSNDGYFLITLSDDEKNGINRNQNIRVHVNRLEVGIVEGLSGTYVHVEGNLHANKADVDLSGPYYGVTLFVRTEEQFKQWKDFMEKEKDRIYGPNDVLPPESNRPDR